MRYIRQYYDTAILLVLLWCILSEDFSPQSIGIGLLFSLMTIFVVRMLFSDNDDVKNYRISPLVLLHYLLVLTWQILLSGIHVVRDVILDRTEPKVVHIRTSINNHWFQCIIANSITLTPGTVTIDKTDHNLQVLWLNPTTKDPDEAARIILGAFEDVLRKGDFHK